jgi:hypothetical protein
MNNLVENNLVKFKNISKKKESLYANFIVKGLRCGVNISASISVDISALELHPGDSLEKIIESSAKEALRQFKKYEFQFEDLPSNKASQYLGVAQLG